MADCSCGTCRGQPVRVETGTVETVVTAADYERLDNLPRVNGVVLVGDKTPADLGITAAALGIDTGSLDVAGAAESAVERALGAADVTDDDIDEIINA